jgi:hypothetical protein
MTIVVEIKAATNTAGTLATLYASDAPFITSPTDTPANTAFINSIMEPGSLGVHVYSDGRTGGASKLESGDLVLANANGQYDDWIGYSFDGRQIIIRSGPTGAAYPSGFVTLFNGTMDGVEASWDKITIRLRDKQFVFERPLLTTKYAGSNVLPDGLEGTATDIKDKVKPRVYGRVFSVTPAFINTSKLTYQVNDGVVSAISAVYDRGGALAVGADFANSTLLQAATPAASSFITCLSEGMFRLGSTPSGQITADVTQGATAAARTVAQVVKSIALAAGLPVGEISAADVTALDTLNSAVIGLYVDSENTFQDCIDQVLGSIGGWCGFDGVGVLRMGVLTAPTGTPVKTLYEYDIHEGVERRAPRDNGIPVYRVTINHTKIYTVQNNDIAGVVPPATRAYLEKEYRSSKAEDTAVKTQWLLAAEFQQDTLLTTAADAATEAARQLGLYKVGRSIYDIPVQSEVFTASGLKFMDLISLEVNRFGMSSGKLFRLIGYNYDLASNKIIIQLWG